jgi:hypothetical protein
MILRLLWALKGQLQQQQQQKRQQQLAHHLSVPHPSRQQVQDSSHPVGLLSPLQQAHMQLYNSRAMAAVVTSTHLSAGHLATANSNNRMSRARQFLRLPRVADDRGVGS